MIENVWINLPHELVNTVLCYAGTIKDRNGKYMSQIHKDDTRYALLRTIPVKHQHHTRIIDLRCYFINVYFSNKRFTCHVYVCSNTILTEVSYRFYNNHDRYSLYILN